MTFLRSAAPVLIGTLLFAIAAIGIAVSMSPQATEAQTSLADIQAQMAAHNKQIQALEAEIAGYQKQLNSLGSTKQTLQTSIKSLDTSRAKLTAQIKSTQAKIDAQNLIILDLQSQISDKAETISIEEAAVAETLRKINQSDDTTLVEQLFSSESLTEVWTTADQMSAFSVAIRDHSQNLAAVREALEGQVVAVDESTRRLSALTSDLSGQRGSLDATKKAKSDLLAQTKAQESSYQSLITQKRAEQSSFQSAIFSLASSLQSADTSTAPPPGKGTLRWPLTSVVVTQQFGRTADSGRLYASGTHDGIDLAAPVGTAIHAALGGTVYEINQGAVQNCQYGKWVLVKHANGLATLYAHLSTISVGKGQSVSSGQVLGYSGMTGYATGPHLHFTVYNANAVSLKQYTCKSGPTVTVPIAPPNGYLNPMSYL